MEKCFKLMFLADNSELIRRYKITMQSSPSQTKAYVINQRMSLLPLEYLTEIFAFFERNFLEQNLKLVNRRFFNIIERWMPQAPYLVWRHFNLDSASFQTDSRLPVYHETRWLPRKIPGIGAAILSEKQYSTKGGKFARLETVPMGSSTIPDYVRIKKASISVLHRRKRGKKNYAMAGAFAYFKTALSDENFGSLLDICGNINFLMLLENFFVYSISVTGFIDEMLYPIQFPALEQCQKLLLNLHPNIVGIQNLDILVEPVLKWLKVPSRLKKKIFQKDELLDDERLSNVVQKWRKARIFNLASDNGSQVIERQLIDKLFGGPQQLIQCFVKHPVPKNRKSSLKSVLIIENFLRSYNISAVCDCMCISSVMPEVEINNHYYGFYESQRCCRYLQLDASLTKADFQIVANHLTNAETFKSDFL